MKYTSTRNANAHVEAAAAIAAGISPEGGLYVPEQLPKVSAAFIQSLLPMSYRERANAVLSLFLTDFTKDEIEACTTAAYGKQFDTDAIAPVRTVGEHCHMLELWHGPTCAFKDMALQILPHLMRVSVQKSAPGMKTVILVATSGDTGKAALEGFKDAPDTRILVFYPQDGVSDMQRLQMVTQEGDNVGVCAIRGNFDHAQTGVKTLFTDPKVKALLEENGMRFSSANSINWGRLLPQIVYYFSAYADLLADGRIQDGESINVVVPTGNFGNILAAYYAKRMGLPVAKLICASNRNRVLTDFFTTGEYNTDRPFFTTTSPSMDILISSNLERLLYHLSGDDAEATATMMAQLKNERRYTVPAEVRRQAEELFAAGCASDEEVAETVRRTWQEKGYLCDTHTAVALKVYEDYCARTGDNTATVIASTANPYKFAPAILAALGVSGAEDTPFAQLAALEETTNHPVPAPLATLREKSVRFTDICEPDAASMQEAVRDLLGLR